MIPVQGKPRGCSSYRRAFTFVTWLRGQYTGMGSKRARRLASVAMTYLPATGVEGTMNRLTTQAGGTMKRKSMGQPHLGGRGSNHTEPSQAEPTRAPTAISRRCCSSCSSLRSRAFASRACMGHQHLLTDVKHGCENLRGCRSSTNVIRAIAVTILCLSNTNRQF